VIPKGTKYHYLAGADESDCGKRFWTFKLCTGCWEDWERITDIQYQNLGETCRCLGALKEKVREASREGWITASDPLVLRWFPEEYKYPRPTEADGQPSFPF